MTHKLINRAYTTKKSFDASQMKTKLDWLLVQKLRIDDFFFGHRIWSHFNLNLFKLKKQADTKQYPPLRLPLIKIVYRIHL